MTLVDDKKHEEAKTPQIQDEEDPEGSMPATGSDEAEESTLEEAHEIGLYNNSTDEGEGVVEEVDIAKQLEEAERKHQRED